MANDQPQQLSGRKVAVLAADGVEQAELTEPTRALRAAGAEVHLVSVDGERIRGAGDAGGGERFDADRSIDGVKVADYHALVIPGSATDRDALGRDDRALALVRGFVEHDKPVAAICHGAHLLVAADVVRGRTLTAPAALREEITGAGGEWVDREVVTDQKLLTSPSPAALPAFCDALVGMLASAAEESALDRAVEQTFPASDPTSFQVPSAIGKTHERRAEPRAEAPPPP